MRCIAGIVLGLLVASSGGSAKAQLPAIDHYLCYQAVPSAGSTPFAPVQRSLQDAFPPLTTFTLKKVTALCTPADKNGEGILRPNDHQVGYRIRALKGSPRFTKRTVAIQDQFGPRTLELVRPSVLLVPSRKVLGSGGAPPYGVPNIRHYKCYGARALLPVPAPTPTVADQFRSVPYKLRRVTKLCAPVDKAGEDPLAITDPGLLVCYKVRGPRFPRTAVSTNNQIRPETLDVVRPGELCVPALLAGPTTTTTSSTTTTVTTAPVTTSSIVIVTTTMGSTQTTTSTLPRPCGDPLNPAPPICWGECPPETPICASTPTGCQCVAGTTPCAGASFPQCDGACAVGEACAVSPTLGCTCQSQGIPCSITFPQCGGLCADGFTCAGPFFTPDGNGCGCVPIGSTCHLTCDPGDTNCPPGQSCQEQLGICFCG